MMFSFGKAKYKGFIDRHQGFGAFNATDQFLANDIGNNMFLCRDDMTGLPKDADPFQKGENNPGDAALDTISSYITVQRRLKPIDIQFHHGVDQFIDHPFLLRLGLVQGQDFFADLFRAHLVDMGNLIAKFIEQGNIQNDPQLLIGVITDIGFRPLRLEKTITLLPYTNGVGLYTRQVFNIFDRKTAHTTDITTGEGKRFWKMEKSWGLQPVIQQPASFYQSGQWA